MYTGAIGELDMRMHIYAYAEAFSSEEHPPPIDKVGTQKDDPGSHSSGAAPRAC